MPGFHLPTSRAAIPVILCSILAASCLPPDKGVQEDAQKIPVTTSSEEAQDLFIRGRDILEKLRATEAHDYFVRAVALDPDFALAHLFSGFTATTNQDFFDSLANALALLEKVSPGEGLLILAADSASRGQPDRQYSYLSQLVQAYPQDERAHTAMAQYYFGRQEYESAIDEYDQAIAINPNFSPPYNQKGYAHRFLGDYDAAEKAFQKYIDLIPDDPNPYDSYAELLMKMGRFDESIETYQKALEIDPHFVASYVGISNNQIFKGDTQQARETLEKLGSQARNVSEHRIALLWTARSYVYDDNHEKAIAVSRARQGLAHQNTDRPALSADWTLVGDIWLDAGDIEAARESYARSVEVIYLASVAEEVKHNITRNNLFNEARVEITAGDLGAARSLIEEYGEQVRLSNIPFEIRRYHEIAGLLSLAEEDPGMAVEELTQADQQDPRVLYGLAQAHRALGNMVQAREVCRQAAHLNSLHPNLPFVRNDALKLLSELEKAAESERVAAHSGD